MSPNVRRDLVLGGAISAIGIGLFAFALFAGDESFRAPRWVVAIIAVGCLVAAAPPLKSVLAAHELTLAPSPLGATLTALLLLVGLLAAWVMVAIGPEGVAITFDIPLPISDDAERVLKSILFYLLFGLIAASCLVGAVTALREAPSALRHTLVVALAASVVGVVAWIVIEFHGQASQPIAPVVYLSFDRRRCLPVLGAGESRRRAAETAASGVDRGGQMDAHRDRLRSLPDRPHAPLRRRPAGRARRRVGIRSRLRRHPLDAPRHLPGA